MIMGLSLAVSALLHAQAAAAPAGEDQPPAPAAEVRESIEEAVRSRVKEGLDDLKDLGEMKVPVEAEFRLDRTAKTASRLLRPLPEPFATGATVVGFVMMLFGRRLFRAGVVLYLMAMLGLFGREIGQRAGGGVYALVGGIVGCVLGAAIALPLRAAVRALIGAMAGGILLAVVAQAVTPSLAVTLAAAAVGVAATGVLTFLFPTPLLIAGFALFGALSASIGILSVATEPVAGYLAYGPAHVAGLLLAAMLGVLFQIELEEDGDDDE